MPSIKEYQEFHVSVKSNISNVSVKLITFAGPIKWIDQMGYWIQGL